MEQETAVFRCSRLVFSETKEQDVACDLLLPDYYPEVDKMLHCRMQLTEESVSLHADQIGVAGRASFTVLYLSAENRVCSYTGVEKYTKLIPCGETKAGDVCRVSQTQAMLNFRAAGPRKIELRAAAAIKAELYRFEETEALQSASAPELQTLTGSTPYFASHAFGEFSFDIRGAVKLPVAREQAAAVLQHGAVCACTEQSAISNKILLRGEAQVSASVITADGAVHAGLQFRLPFTEARDLFGAAENDVCFVSFSSAEAELNLKASLGEPDAAELLVRVRCAVLTGKAEERTFLKDAYAPGAVPELTSARVRVLQSVSAVEASFPFSQQAEYYDDGIPEVCDAFVSDLRFAPVSENGAEGITCSASLNALLKNKTGAFSFVSRSASFTFERPGGGAGICGMFCRSVSAAVEGGGTIRFTGEFVLRGFETAETEENALTAVSLPQTPAHGRRERIVVYYAGAGESVWEIAKENGSAVSVITELNGLKQDVLEENKVLVFSAR